MRTAFVLGLGVSGQAAAGVLLDEGVTVYGFDDASVDFPALQEKGLQITQGLQPADMVIVSPGISPRHPIYQEALTYGIPVIGEAELGLRRLRHRTVVGITGTNGKTTVTLLVAAMLNASGLPAKALGNVGKSLVAESPHGEEIIVAELSSYQLETCQVKALSGALLLNITDDHLDRHGTLEAYALAKARIGLLRKSPNAKFFVEENTAERYSDLLSCQSFETYGLADGMPLPQGVCGHDAMNIIAATKLSCSIGGDPAACLEAAHHFRKPEHRMELVCRIRDVSYVNDSKGTNLAAVESAVQATPGPIVLIAGGRHKGAPFSPWLKSFEGRVSHIIAIGETAPMLEHDLGKRIPVTCCKTLDEAVSLAGMKAVPGGTVLLSPGCSSFDMFRDYAHRGEEFKRCVKEKC